MSPTTPTVAHHINVAHDHHPTTFRPPTTPTVAHDINVADHPTVAHHINVASSRITRRR